MKQILAITILVSLVISESFADIIKNKCFGYKGFGDLAGNVKSNTWTEEIDTQKKTYRFKNSGSNWKSTPNKIVFMNDEIIKMKET